MVNQTSELESVPERQYATHEETLQAIVHPDHIEQQQSLYDNLETHLQMGTLTLDLLRKTLVEDQSILILAASKDYMTGLDNARSANIKLEQMMRYCERQALPLTAIYLDSDGLKQLNTMGHDIGDIAIKALGEAIAKSTRPTDLPTRPLSEEEAKKQQQAGLEEGARLGGDEFWVVFPGADLENAQKMFDRIQQNYGDITSANLPQEAKNQFGVLKVTGGAIQYDPNIDHTPDGLVKRAERAMQFGKEHTKGNLYISAVPINSGPK